MTRLILAISLLLALAPAVESKSVKAQCKSRCSVMYGACLKRTTTAKGRALCKTERASCKGGCVVK